MTAKAETQRPTPSWWVRALLVLGAPRPVFAALRDDSDEEAERRVETILAILLLAGVAAVLAVPVDRFLEADQIDDAWLVGAWAFIGGAAYAAGAYWVGGLLLRTASKQLGSVGSGRRSRHLLAFASVPLALAAVVLLPARLAVDGYDGIQHGGTRAFQVAHIALALWALALVVVGVRAVHGWSWARSAAAVGLAAALPGVLVLATL